MAAGSSSFFCFVFGVLGFATPFFATDSAFSSFFSAGLLSLLFAAAFSDLGATLATTLTSALVLAFFLTGEPELREPPSPPLPFEAPPSRPSPRGLSQRLPLFATIDAKPAPSLPRRPRP